MKTKILSTIAVVAMMWGGGAARDSHGSDAVRNAHLLRLIVRAMNASSFNSTDRQSQGIDRRSVEGSLATEGSISTAQCESTSKSNNNK